MSRTPTNALTTEQAVTRARQMIESGRKLSQATDAVTDARSGEAVRAAEILKDERLLSYRVTTIPDTLTPVLEALIAAASKNAEPAGARP